MFSNPRYMTRGVQESVPLDLQIAIWSLIDKRKQDQQQELDYLQVFDCSVDFIGDHPVQRVIHTQEIPAYCQEHRFSILEPTTTKVWVIDDGHHSTMLLPSDVVNHLDLYVCRGLLRVHTNETDIIAVENLKHLN